MKVDKLGNKKTLKVFGGGGWLVGYLSLLYLIKYLYVIFFTYSM